MAQSGALSLACFAIVLLSCSCCAAYAGTVGVDWDQGASDLPHPAAVVQLLKQRGITRVKLYDAEPTVLRALANTGIKVVVTMPNAAVAAAATRPSFALAWVRRNVAAFYPGTQIQAIAVGNEVFATAQLVPAMANVHVALARLGIHKAVKVSSSETGWPSNLVRRVLSGGTPRRPSQHKVVYDVEFVLGGPSPSSGTAPATKTGEAWCVANATSGQQKLQEALDHACGAGGADCQAIQPGAACFEPNSLVAHASYAFNDLFQRTGTCYFGGAACIVTPLQQGTICATLLPTATTAPAPQDSGIQNKTNSRIHRLKEELRDVIYAFASVILTLISALLFALGKYLRQRCIAERAAEEEPEDGQPPPPPQLIMQSCGFNNVIALGPRR